jgi:hypothetical protein
MGEFAAFAAIAKCNHTVLFTNDFTNVLKSYNAAILKKSNESLA